MILTGSPSVEAFIQTEPKILLLDTE